MHVDQQGKQTFERNSFQTERLDIMDNPLFEQMYKSQNMGEEETFSRNNMLVAYHLALDDKYDLDNYLQHKRVTPHDLFRGIYTRTWLFLGLSNRYRYEHFIYKPDVVYSF